jgi:hypothetical protein
MTDLCWGGAIFLTSLGALCYWGAGIFAGESFYYPAAWLLFLALLCAVLAGGA